MFAMAKKKLLPWVNSLLPFLPLVVINASEGSHFFKILKGTCLNKFDDCYYLYELVQC
jgi:hypothetical protein